MIYNKGFDIQQIWRAYKEYKFESVEEGIFLMMKDEETKKYPHKYFRIEIKEVDIDESNVDTNLKNNMVNNCAICGEAQSEHLESLSNMEFVKENVKIQPITINFAQILINELDNEELCRICFTNKIDPLIIKQKLVCGHIFCLDCIKNQLTTRILNGQVT